MMSRLARDETPEPVSQDPETLRRERGQGKNVDSPC